MALKELRRVLSKLGVASRREAEEMIKAGRVKVNGRIIKDPLQPVNISAEILIDNNGIPVKKLIVYALNKPRGVVTTMAREEQRTKISDLLPKAQYLFPVGRLDKASRGLLLITNDNDFADFLLDPASGIEKIYRVQVSGEFTSEKLISLRQGVVINGIKYQVKSAELLRVNPKTSWLEITLTEGKNREIRKIMQTLGFEVLDLIRVQIGKLKLEELELNPGKYIEISKSQIL